MPRPLFLAVCLLAGWMCAGCATVAQAPLRLNVTVAPDTIYPGSVVTVTVLAPMELAEVTGRLDWAGSPVVPFRSPDQGRTWSFTTQIPLGTVWRPGQYRVLATGKTASNEVLQGEAWVNAP